MTTMVKMNLPYITRVFSRLGFLKNLREIDGSGGGNRAGACENRPQTFHKRPFPAEDGIGKNSFLRCQYVLQLLGEY